jgi:hypothetical protein
LEESALFVMTSCNAFKLMPPWCMKINYKAAFHGNSRFIIHLLGLKSKASKFMSVTTSAYRLWVVIDIIIFGRFQSSAHRSITIIQLITSKIWERESWLFT